MILAPLRGVTIRCFRVTFGAVIASAGFTEAITPFISAIAGVDPLKDRELRGGSAADASGIKVTPQLIGKDPVVLRFCLERLRDAGYDTVDLNCGCPFPMVRKKGRGSGMLRSPDLLRRMLEAGCEALGPGKFSMKARLGVEHNDELLRLMPMLNEFPLRFLTVHARNAKQMYEGKCDMEALAEVERVAKMPIVRNGDLDWREGRGMVGRSFIRDLGLRSDIRELLGAYIDASARELWGERPVLGRIKELMTYWKDLPEWKQRWNILKICRSVDEVLSII